MSQREVFAHLQQGATIADTLSNLDGKVASGRPLAVSAHDFALPYLDHVVAGFVDGPPSSEVAAVISGAAPGGGWRRFTLSRSGPWRYVLEVFPTAFNNADAPLAPGIPPATSRQA
jgi:hypothetical protein